MSEPMTQRLARAAGTSTSCFPAVPDRAVREVIASEPSINEINQVAARPAPAGRPGGRPVLSGLFGP